MTEPDLPSSSPQVRAKPAEEDATSVAEQKPVFRGVDLLEENGGWIGEKFRLVEKIGEGGFGLVYRAEQVQPISRQVAIKILKAGMNTQQVISRFENERQSLARMEHPNIARVLDAGETERGLPYFVMELVRGRSIVQYAKQEKLDVRQRIELFIDVCHAVNHAHLKGIIHRDLKPSNVMVMEEDGHPVPKVIDFGIAKVLEQKSGLQHTLGTGMDQLVGTPGYISPEQIEHGSSHVDTRSDVYALGSILLELLSGRPLVTPADMAQRPVHQILRDQMELDAPRPSLREPSLKGDLDWIILRALEREPDRRYRSADALAEDLKRHLHDEPVLASPPGKSYLIQKFIRRHRAAVVAALAVTFAVLAGGITSTIMYWRSEESRQEARRASSASDTQMASQMQEGERVDLAASLAFFCRALRTDPENAHAAVNLLTLLQHRHLIQPLTDKMPLPAGCMEARFVAVSPALQRVLAVSGISTGSGSSSRDILCIWDMLSGIRRDYPLPEGVLATGLMVSADGEEAYLSQDDGVLKRWSLQDEQVSELMPRLPEKRKGEPQSILVMSLSGDGRTLVAGGEAGALALWDLEKPDQKGHLMQHPAPEGTRAPISGLALDYLGQVIATASHTMRTGSPQTESIVAVWDRQSGQILGDLVKLDQGVSALAIHRERQWLAIGLYDGVVHVLDYQALTEPMPELNHPSAVTSLAFHSDASALYVGDGSGLLHVWNTKNGRPQRPAVLHDGELMGLHPRLKQGLLISTSRHGEARVWDLHRGSAVSQRMRHSLAEASVSGDGTLLAIAPRYDPHVQIWILHQRMTTPRFLAGAEETLDPELVKPTQPVPQVLSEARVTGWSAEKDWVAVSSSQGKVLVVNPKTGAALGPAVLHPPAVGALALSANGQLLATSGRDQAVRLWQVKTGKPTGILLRHSSFVSSLAMSQDGKRLITLTDEGELRIWDAEIGSSLCPPIPLGSGASRLSLELGEETLRFFLPERGWFSLPLPPNSPGVLPEWFIDLAEALARRKLTSEGHQIELSRQQCEDCVLAVPKSVETDDERLALQWAKWLLAPANERPLSPQSTQTLDAYLEELKKSPSASALIERDRFQH